MFLNDQQLKTLLGAQAPLVSNFPGAWSSLPLDSSRWDAADSPVQPASLDLHVGEIFIPGEEEGKIGSVGKGAGEKRGLPGL